MSRLTATRGAFPVSPSCLSFVALPLPFPCLGLWDFGLDDSPRYVDPRTYTMKAMLRTRWTIGLWTAYAFEKRAKRSLKVLTRRDENAAIKFAEIFG